MLHPNRVIVVFVASCSWQCDSVSNGSVVLWGGNGANRFWNWGGGLSM